LAHTSAWQPPGTTGWKLTAGKTSAGMNPHTLLRPSACSAGQPKLLRLQTTPTTQIKNEPHLSDQQQRLEAQRPAKAPAGINPHTLLRPSACSAGQPKLLRPQTTPTTQKRTTSTSGLPAGSLWLSLTTMSQNDFPHTTRNLPVLGACFEVYREKGCGFLEPVYQECLEIELGLQKIRFVAKPSLRLEYKGQPLKHTYEPDLICFETVVVELKAVSELANEHRSQLLNYLNATGLP
jgi:GxxExxY protein